jgi:hypothetical protein
MTVFLDALSDAWGQMTGTPAFVAQAFGENWRTGLAALLDGPTALFYLVGVIRSSPSRSAVSRSGAGSAISAAGGATDQRTTSGPADSNPPCKKSEDMTAPTTSAPPK